MPLNVNGVNIDNVICNKEGTNITINTVVVNGVTVWQRESTAFSSTTYISENPYMEVARKDEVINNDYISSVSSVLYVSTGDEAEKSEVIFTPTARAKELFKYALVTVRAYAYISYGSAIAKIQNTTLFSTSTDGTTKYTTVKIPLSSIGNLYVYAKDNSSTSTYFTRTSIAVEKIVLTNEE